jgi:hypothetical protein
MGMSFNQKLFNKMKKTTNNYFRIIIILTSLSVLFSVINFQAQLAIAQNKGNNLGILPKITPAQQQQLAANGTSFDGFIKHRIAVMNAAKIPTNYTSISDRLLKGINICVSPLGKAFAQTLCDFTMATIYEICQAIPDRMYVCVTPSVNSYIKDRNLVDGQTDKLAWQFVLHQSEILTNPYVSSNSTAIITNTTAMGQTGADTISMKMQLKPHENEFLAKDGYYQVRTFELTANNAKGICMTNNCQFTIGNAEFRPNNASGGYVFEGILKSTISKADEKISKFINMHVDLGKTGSVERAGKTTEMLEGQIDFGKNSFSPDFTYKVVNGTLQTDPHSPILNLQAKRG